MAKNQKSYTPEFKQQIVELYIFWYKEDDRVIKQIWRSKRHNF